MKTVIEMIDFELMKREIVNKFLYIEDYIKKRDFFLNREENRTKDGSGIILSYNVIDSNNNRFIKISKPLDFEYIGDYQKIKFEENKWGIKLSGKGRETLYINGNSNHYYQMTGEFQDNKIHGLRRLIEVKNNVILYEYCGYATHGIIYNYEEKTKYIGTVYDGKKDGFGEYKTKDQHHTGWFENDTLIKVEETFV